MCWRQISVAWHHGCQSTCTCHCIMASGIHQHKPKALIHIINDFRGAGLQQILTHKADSNVCHSHLHFKFNVKSGAKLETIAKIAIDQKNAFDIQVILGGICSLTSKQGKVVSYEHRDDNLQEIKDNINVFFTKLQRRLLICTIPPANVIKSNQYHRVQTASQFEQQQQLEKRQTGHK